MYTPPRNSNDGRAAWRLGCHTSAAVLEGDSSLRHPYGAPDDIWGKADLSEQQKTEHVLALNLARRHLSREQRAQLVVRLRQMNMSTRQIATAMREPKSNVARDLSEVLLSHVGQLPTRIVDLDGRERPAQRSETPIPAPTLFCHVRGH